MHYADILALTIYLGALVGIGFWVARRVKSMEEFVMPRRFGKVLMVTFAFGTGTHADEAVGVSSKTFTNGLSGIWYQWLFLFCTPFYWLIAPVMKRFRAITTADVFEARYDKSVASIYTLVGIATLMVDMGVMLKAFGAIVNASTGFPERTAIALVTIVFVVYSVAGGLAAGIITDFIQGALTVLFSVILLPFVFHAVGGMAGIHAQIANPALLSMVAPGDIGVFYIFMISLCGLVGICTQPYTLSGCSAGKNEMNGRVGFMGGNMIKRFCTIAWCLVGLAAIVYFRDRPEVKPDQVWGFIAKDFLNQAMPGLLGIFLASLLASLQSTANAVMISSSGLFTENVYKPLVKGRSRRHYLFVARAAAIATVVGAVIFAWTVGEVTRGLEIFWSVATLMGLAFWLGVFWRRTTIGGAWASFVVATAVWGLTLWGPFIKFVAALPFTPALHLVSQTKPEIYLPWAMLAYLTAGVLAGIGVSYFPIPALKGPLDKLFAFKGRLAGAIAGLYFPLGLGKLVTNPERRAWLDRVLAPAAFSAAVTRHLTRMFTEPVPEAQVENFYALLRTPTEEGGEITAPCTLSPGVEVPPRRPLLPWFKNLEAQVPTRVSMYGFLFGWGFVVFIIYGFYLITKA